MSDAIFTSTGQALSVSYLVMSLPARQKNSFRQALLQIIEGVELPSARLKAWYMQLKGERSGSTVNFDGLDPDEVRAQCAMVTQVVKDHLPGPEQWVIWAKYSNQVDRAAGVKGLAEYVAPMLTISDQMAIRALVYGHFAPHMRNRGLSYEDISKDRGIHVKTLKRASSLIAQTSGVLEKLAVDRLTPMFQRDGLVPWELELTA